MTKAAKKQEVAKANREAIIARIQAILKETGSYMTLKTAMEVFLGAQCTAKVDDPSFGVFFMNNGYQAVYKAAYRATPRNPYANLSEAAQRQMPGSWR